MGDEDNSPFIQAVKYFTKITPCVRDSLISGITGGLAVGVGTFILSSSSKKGYKWGFGAYFLLSQIQYFACKYKEIAQKRYAEQARIVMRERSLREGTADALPDSRPATNTDDIVPLDELEFFERRAIEKDNSYSLSAAPPPPASPHIPVESQQSTAPPCDCN